MFTVHDTTALPPLTPSRSALQRSEVQKKALEQGVTDASAENLRKVGFPEKMCRSPVAVVRHENQEASKINCLGGWHSPQFYPSSQFYRT